MIDFVKLGLVLLAVFILYNIAVSSGLMTDKLSNFLPFPFSGKEKEPQMINRPSGLTKVQENTPTITKEGPVYDSTVKPHMEEKSQLYEYNSQVLPYPQISTNPQDSYFNTGGLCAISDSSCLSGSTLHSPDLLPKDGGANAWTDTSPRTQGSLTDSNYLESGYHFGINTVGQSLKNPNLSIRSDPPIPRTDIGPWSQSTVDPDTNRRGFEIEP